MKILRRIGRSLKYKVLFKMLEGLEYVVERELLRAIVMIILMSFVLSNIKSNTWQFWATPPVLIIFMLMQYMKGRKDGKMSDKELEMFIARETEGMIMLKFNELNSQKKGTN